MSNLCKILISISIMLFLGCSKTDQGWPFYKAFYVYKNKMNKDVFIEFYLKTREKKLKVTDSISVDSYDVINGVYYSFSPPSNCDSVIIKFHDGKIVVFKPDPNSSNWKLNPTNYNSYKSTQEIKGNLTTTFYIYTIDKKIYELAK